MVLWRNLPFFSWYIKEICPFFFDFGDIWHFLRSFHEIYSFDDICRFLRCFDKISRFSRIFEWFFFSASYPHDAKNMLFLSNKHISFLKLCTFICKDKNESVVHIVHFLLLGFNLLMLLSSALIQMYLSCQFITERIRKIWLFRSMVRQF